MRAILIAAFVVAASSGCLKPSSVSCADGRVCPEGHACDLAHGTCVLPDQLTSCQGAADGTPCEIVGKPAVCHREVCVDPFCGDGIVSEGEQCDVAAAASDCTSIGYYEHGQLGCTPDCKYDETSCTGGKCGDATIQPAYEVCDVEPPKDASCFDYGFESGRLACNSYCTFDFSSCGHVGWHSEKNPDLALFANAVWGTGRDNVYTVGYAGHIVHYDGLRWLREDPGTTVLSVNGKTLDYNAVWGTAPDDVYAVGALDAIAHFDGTKWSLVAPIADTPQSWFGIWGTSANDVFVVGTYGAIKHFDGTSWSTQVAPDFSVDRLLRVWGRASNDVYAVGRNSLIRHFNGSTWSTMAIDSSVPTSIISGVWGVGSKTYAVGGSRVLELVGSTWMPFQIYPGATLRAIWGTAPDNFFVSSDKGVLHWDGVRLELQDSVDVVDVWGSGATDILAVGGNKIRRRGALIAIADLVGKIGAIHGSTASDALSVGATASRWDGTMWTAIAMPSGTTLTDVWSPAPGDAFGATRGSGLVRWNSGTNTWTTLAGSWWLRSVWGVSASDVYAVGGTNTHTDGTGQIVHWNGTSVTPVLSRPNDLFHAVWGSSTSDVFATTYLGAIVHTNGAGWTEQRAGGTAREPLISLWGTGPSDVYAAGVSLQAGGRILHYDGTTWADQDPGLPVELQHLAGFGPSDIWVTTKDTGLVLHSDGTRWEPVRLLGADSPIMRGAWAVPMPAPSPGASRTRRMMFAGYSYGTDNRIYRLERSCEASELACSDRGDDDCDGLVDCLDTDCMGDASCSDGGLCRSALPAACGASIDGDSRSGAWRIDNYRSGPRPETGPESSYRFTAATTGIVTVSLSGFTNDLDLLVVPAAATGGCAPTSGVVSVASTTNANEVLTFQAAAGTTYYIVVDGYAGAYSAFHLDVTCM